MSIYTQSIYTAYTVHEYQGIGKLGLNWRNSSACMLSEDRFQLFVGGLPVLLVDGVDPVEQLVNLRSCRTTQLEQWSDGWGRDGWGRAVSVTMRK
jgi:hypothetical protein